ncbi:MAG: hypothetical protein J6L59_01430 [Clostridia bacterium]|nr:hypothetical protein [Clostridia bacterium]
MHKSTAQLKRIIKIMRSKWIYMVLAGILLAFLSSFITCIINPPLFVAEVTVYVNNSSELKPGTQKNVTTVDLLVSEILVPTYITMLKSNTALQDTLNRSAVMEYTVDDLRNAIYAETVPGTALVKLSVEDKDPENAKILANCLIDTLNEVVAEHIEGSSVGVIDKAQTPARRLPEGIKRTFIISFFAGFLTCFTLLCISERKKALVSSVDDLKKLFDLPVLGTVPCILSFSDNEENIKR